jgi:hypothetical protein
MEKSEKTQNIVAGILAALVLALLTAMGYSYALASRGDKAFQDLLVFVALFLLMCGFTILARWQMADLEIPVLFGSEDKSKEGNDGQAEKGFVQKIIDKENPAVNSAVKAAFHLLPLYFTLFLFKIDLYIGFKAAIFIFLMFAYLLIELSYIFNWALGLVKRLNLKTKLGIAALVGGIPLLMFAAIVYFVIGVINFYMQRFPAGN